MMSQGLGMDKPYSYSEVGDTGIYIRKTYGYETYFATQSLLHEGTGHLSYSIQIDAVIPLEACAVHAAWTRTRFRVPHIASTIFGAPPPSGSFFFQYVVPADAAAAARWAQVTVKFEYLPAETLFVRHRSITKHHVWLPDTHHFSTELHVCPLVGGGWVLSLVAGHEIADARGISGVLDILLEELNAELSRAAPALESIRWGDEVVRLSPALAVLLGGPADVPPQAPIAIGGLEGALTAENGVDLNGFMAKMASLSAYLRPWKVSREAAYAGALSRELSSVFHFASKATGATITHVATALGMLTHVETYLRLQSRRDPEHFSEVVEQWRGIDYFLMNASADLRFLLPEEYRTLQTSRGSPLLALGGSVLLIPLENVKKIITVDTETLLVNRTWDSDVFISVVKDVSSTLRRVKFTADTSLRLDVLAGRTSIAESVVSSLPIPKLEMVSSVGDLNRLGLFNRFLPDMDPPSKRAVILRDLTSHVRCRDAAHFKMTTVQLNGKLRFQWRAGAGQDSSIEELVAIFKSNVDAFLNVRAAVSDVGIDLGLDD